MWNAHNFHARALNCWELNTSSYIKRKNRVFKSPPTISLAPKHKLYLIKEKLYFTPPTCWKSLARNFEDVPYLLKCNISYGIIHRDHPGRRFDNVPKMYPLHCADVIFSLVQNRFAKRANIKLKGPHLRHVSWEKFGVRYIVH